MATVARSRDSCRKGGLKAQPEGQQAAVLGSSDRRERQAERKDMGRTHSGDGIELPAYQRKPER
jgi:hypothetical protein